MMITTILLLWSIPLLIQFNTVTTVDVLVPISTIAPNASFYPNIVHPRPPQRLNLTTKRALHTNKYYINPLLGQGNNPMLVHPYILEMNPAAPYGVSISCTETVILGPKIDDTRVKYFINMILKNLEVSATEFTTQNFQVIDVDHPGLGLTLKMSQENSAASITMPIVRGMAYVTFEFDSATPHISTEHAIISINNQTSGQTTGKRFEIVLNNNQTWILYTLNGDITLDFRDNQLFGSQPITNVLRVAKKQPTPEANSVLDSHFSVYPTGCQLKADVTGSTGTYTFLWERKGDLTNTLLHYTFAHHRQIISPSSATSTTIQTRSSTKGPMIAYLGNTWILTEDSLSTMGFLAPRSPAAPYAEQIISQLKQDIATGVDLHVSDYYFSGKAFHKYALLCLLTDYYNLTTLREQCIQTIETAFDVLLTAKNANALRYDTTWFGLVSAAGLG
jgi:endo-1,3(4)-beta-glucanase